MLRRLAVLVVLVAGILGAQTANAWHAVDVTVTAACNPQTGQFDITATILQSSQWPGATVKSVTPASVPGNKLAPVDVTVVIGWATTSETQTFTRTVKLGTQMCSVVCEPQVVERVVYVDRPVEVVREVVKEVPVVKVVTRTVVKWRTKVVTKWKTRTVVKTKVIHDRCVPPPDDPDCEGKCDWPKKYGGNG